ncbi:MAG: undecaprenyldiphospho-muramoylpentapeptide beta-N-acetylglucosaminyltransferase [bacterium]
MVAAGGTGGHILPALALAEEMRRRGHGVCWVGRENGLEATIVRARDIEFEAIPAAGFSGRSPVEQAAWPFTTARGCLRSLGILRRRTPDAVVAAGGYVGVGPLSAAWLTGVPYFLIEQNRIPGRATRAFAPGARRVLLGFPAAVDMHADTVVTGNPLRPEVVADGRTDDGRTVLVLGGSQGARALNLAALDAAGVLMSVRFILLTGRRDFDLVRSQVRTNNIELVDYTDRPHELYRRATIAVSRAGGMVLSELAAFGIPAILIPYPHATDRHQEANAQYLTSLGAASTLDQYRLSGLVSEIKLLLADAERRQRMSDAARAAARPDAAAAAAGEIEKCLAA